MDTLPAQAVWVRRWQRAVGARLPPTTHTLTSPTQPHTLTLLQLQTARFHHVDTIDTSGRNLFSLGLLFLSGKGLHPTRAGGGEMEWVGGDLSDGLACVVTDQVDNLMCTLMVNYRRIYQDEARFAILMHWFDIFISIAFTSTISLNASKLIWLSVVAIRNYLYLPECARWLTAETTSLRMHIYNLPFCNIYTNPFQALRTAHNYYVTQDS